VNLSKIIWINVLLSGGNALVVALACRGLAPRQRLWGMVLGSAAAVILRIIFTVVIATLMGLPYLKLTSGLMLLVIAAKLLMPESKAEDDVESASRLWAAVQIVVLADIAISLDNVIAVAAAANGSILLLIFGLASSIPLIIAGAALILALLEMLPVLIWVGSALLGWIAGDVIVTDPAMHPKLQSIFEGATGVELDTLLTLVGVAPVFVSGNGDGFACAAFGVIVVLVTGSIWRRQGQRKIAQGTPQPCPELQEFYYSDLPAQVLSILLETGLAPHRLELEITEGVLVNDFERAIGTLRRLKALGVSIAMDDFGTGYSSLRYLQAFPFDKIKVNKSFIDQLDENLQSQAIIRAVVGLAPWPGAAGAGGRRGD
jgi:YjbE family integral membrane protein